MFEPFQFFAGIPRWKWKRGSLQIFLHTTVNNLVKKNRALPSVTAIIEKPCFFDSDLSTLNRRPPCCKNASDKVLRQAIAGLR